MDIAHRRMKRSVAHEPLDDLGIAGLLVDPGAKRMPKDMRRNVSVDARLLSSSVDLARLGIGRPGQNTAMDARKDPRIAIPGLILPTAQ